MISSVKVNDQTGFVRVSIHMYRSNLINLWLIHSFDVIGLLKKVYKSLILLCCYAYVTTIVFIRLFLVVIELYYEIEQSC